MASALSRLNRKVRLLVPLALLGLHFQTHCALNAQTQGLQQHFTCTTGYTAQQCQAAAAVLRKAVTHYRLDELGEWTWILVPSVDWKQILSARGIDPNDPAFSNLTRRKTFLDGSLIEAVSIRGMELRLVWHMPIEELLDLTIRHELAHAFCNERDERKARQMATALKNGDLPSCEATQVAKKQAEDRSTVNAWGFDRQDGPGGSAPVRHLNHHSDGELPEAPVNPTGNQPRSK